MCVGIVLCPQTEVVKRVRPPERAPPPKMVLPPRTPKASALEYFLLSLSPSTIQHNLSPKLKRMLDKYRCRVEKWEKRLIQPGGGNSSLSGLLALGVNRSASGGLKGSNLAPGGREPGGIPILAPGG
ncbi:hypothetical protein NQ318_010957 [Aromia moschata]|uniref:Uncharacterized protein n=1 Tax=Aromia moschata TaxID=1265417 RepID=A0AAV8YMD6_9CUCU|nr:hypothetical protein NQ318_010957 [Aromia moschata]